MNDAVVLNCGDTVSEVARKTLSNCPVCSAKITDSFPNLLVRRQVSLLEKKEGERGDYPLKRVKFVMTKDWRKDKGPTWTYAFKPKDPDSFITIVQYQGYRNGRTSLYVDYKKLGDEKRILDELKDYLEAKGVGSHSVGWPPNNDLLDGENIQKLFAILAANNDFPPEELKHAQKLVDNCHDWRKSDS